VPPAGVTEALPLVPPLQAIFVCDQEFVVILVGCAIANVRVAWQVLPSVMVTV
jgi:hypothetical protein